MARPEVFFKLGRCYEELGDTGMALNSYLGVYVNYPGQLEWSAEAWYRAAVLQWEKGKAENSKQNAYDLIDTMYKRMGHLAGNKRDTGDFIRKAVNKRDEWAAELGVTPTS